jgi:hypothetical protein
MSRAKRIVPAKAITANETIGRAIAGARLDEPPEKVTPSQAVNALIFPDAIDDPRRTRRAIRAAMGALATASPGVTLGPLIQVIVGKLDELDGGQARDWTVPAPKRRGRPAEPTSDTHALAVEVNYQEVLFKCSRDRAIGIVTGVWRGRKLPTAPLPIMPCTGSSEALRKRVKFGEAIDQKLEFGEIAEARRGDAVSVDFLRRRSQYIAAWNARRKVPT